MSQTDRILPRYFLSRVRVSIRPRIFLYAKKPRTSHPLTDRPGRMLQRHRPSERRNLKGSYTFTPGGDSRHNSHKMSASAMDGFGISWFCWRPGKPPGLRESYPLCKDPAKHCCDPAKCGSVCEAFEKKPLYGRLPTIYATDPSASES